jgi:membrane-bound lytic murein transglycosylase B
MGYAPAMSAPPSPTPPRSPQDWIAYRIGGRKAAWLGHIKAATMDNAIAEAAKEFGVPARRILVQQLVYA